MIWQTDTEILPNAWPFEGAFSTNLEEHWASVASKDEHWNYGQTKLTVRNDPKSLTTAGAGTYILAIIFLRSW